MQTTTSRTIERTLADEHQPLTYDQVAALIAGLVECDDYFGTERILLRLVRAVPGMPYVLPGGGELAMAASRVRDLARACALAITHERGADAEAALRDLCAALDVQQLGLFGRN